MKLYSFKDINNQNMALTSEQQVVLDNVACGKNILITGGAGVGKTYLIRRIAQCDSLRNIAVTSTTGTSSILINGTTLHAYLGIGIGTGSVEQMRSSIMKKKFLRERWQRINILIIDEISMLTARLFDKLEELARMVRKSNKPFGGIQLILSGDFCQLPPIGVSSGAEEFCFEADSWNSCIGKQNVMILKTILRQADPLFQETLNQLRMGIVTSDVKEVFSSCIGRKFDDPFIQPTNLFPLNRSVDEVNNKNFTKTVEDTQHQIYEYAQEVENSTEPMNKRTREAAIEKYKKYSIIPDQLQLCVGCQVMLIHNLDLTDEGEKKLVNGSRGVVIKFVNDLPYIKFKNGKECVIDYHEWEIEESDINYGKIIQIPLRLGYAFSIHKSQGCTLDMVRLDLRNIFDYGMGYVALSRVCDLSSLSIIGIDWAGFKTHPKVIEYYNSCDGTSEDEPNIEEPDPPKATSRLLKMK